MKELYRNTSISFYDQLYLQVPSWFKRMNRQKRRVKIKQGHSDIIIMVVFQYLKRKMLVFGGDL